MTAHKSQLSACIQLQRNSANGKRRVRNLSLSSRLSREPASQTHEVWPKGICIFHFFYPVTVLITFPEDTPKTKKGLSNTWKLWQHHHHHLLLLLGLGLLHLHLHLSSTTIASPFHMGSSSGSLETSANSHPLFSFSSFMSTSYSDLLTSADEDPVTTTTGDKGAVGRGLSDRIAERTGSGVPKFKSIPPPSLPISPPPISPSSYFSIPAGLSPAELLDSPVLLSTSNVCVFLLPLFSCFCGGNRELDSVELSSIIFLATKRGIRT